MPRPASATLMTALGFSADVDRLYHRLLAQTGREVGVVAQALMTTAEELLESLAPLSARGIVRLAEGRVHVDTPAAALARVVAETARSAEQAHERLTSVTAALPFLSDPPGLGGRYGAASPDPGADGGTAPLDGELIGGGEPVGLIAELLRHRPGDLCWLRAGGLDADQESGLLDLVRESIAGGRRSRAIYPFRALGAGAEVVRSRAALGEEVRVLADLPTSLLVIGQAHVLVPEPLGYAGGPRSLVRQRGLVQALQLWFEALWERATPVPGLERPGTVRADLRRLLFQELAAGAQDEQIARRLGVSLRTVRRRVAEAMVELGADTRFQAGVEAVRRGWL